MLLNENGYTEASTQSIIQMSKQLNFVMLGNVIMREIITKPVDNKTKYRNKYWLQLYMSSKYSAKRNVTKHLLYKLLKGFKSRI